MLETSDSRVCQKNLSFENCMISPFELRQHEFLPASINPSKGLTNLGLNGLELHDLPKNGDARSSSNELPFYPLEKRFLIFDQCGDETRLMFSSLLPQVQDLTKYPASLFCANRLTAVNQQTNKAEHVWVKAPIINEESCENEVVEEGSEMQEDTEEINALLYSDGDDSNCDSEDDDDQDEEASTGHSPLAKDFEDLDDFEISSKRQKTLDGEHNELPGIKVRGDEEFSPINGRKRPRIEKIHDTLKVLEGIIPGVKSKNPLAILDEAISYLKCLKRNAEFMATEDRQILFHDKTVTSGSVKNRQ